MKISFNKSGKIGLLAVLITCTCSCHINARKADKELTGYAVFQKYLKTKGEEASLRNVSTYSCEYKMYKDGDYLCTTNVYIRYPDKVAIKNSFHNGSVIWDKLIGGTAVEIKEPDSVKVLEGEEKLSLKKTGYIFPSLYFLDHGYHFKIVNNYGHSYKIKIWKGNFNVYYYIDKRTFQLSEIKYKNMETYPVKDTTIRGIKMTWVSKLFLTSQPLDTFVSITQYYKINPKINDTIFEIK